MLTHFTCVQSTLLFMNTHPSTMMGLNPLETQNDSFQNDLCKKSYNKLKLGFVWVQSSTTNQITC